MGTMQTNLQATRASEIKARTSEESLQKEIASLKEKLVAFNSSEAASTTTIKLGQSASSAAIETTLEVGAGTVDADIAPQPAGGEGANEVQLADGTKTKDQSTEDPNLQSASGAETTETIPDASNVGAATAATIVDQKKGRKRKANAPKKNAASGSAVEIVDVDAPPLKKATTPANNPVVGTEPVVDNTIVPTEKKVVVSKKVGAKKIVPSSASTDVAPDNHSTVAAESMKLPMSKKFTKKSIVANKNISSTPSTASAAGGVTDNSASTADSNKEEEMRMKLEL